MEISFAFPLCTKKIPRKIILIEPAIYEILLQHLWENAICDLLNWLMEMLQHNTMWLEYSDPME